MSQSCKSEHVCRVRPSFVAVSVSLHLNTILRDDSYEISVQKGKENSLVSTPAMVGHFFWLYGFEKSCNKRPKHHLCEYNFILVSFLTVELAFLVPPEEFFEFPRCHVKDSAHGYWKPQHRSSLQSASVSE